MKIRSLLMHAAFCAAITTAITFSAFSTQAAEDTDSWAGIQTTKIAEVASVSGRVEANDGAGHGRTLQRGDAVYAGERVMTASNSSVGLWLDETLGQPEGSLAQLEGNSRARLTRAHHEGGARVTLEQGAVRIVDPREDGAGPAIELAALDSETLITGGDREARILSEKTGPYAVMCDWEKPMTVARGAQTQSAAPGGCVIGNNREPLFAAPAHGDRIPLLVGPQLLAMGPDIDPNSLLGPPPGVLPPVAGQGPNPLVSGLTPPGLPINPLADLNPCGANGSGCTGAGGGGLNGGTGGGGGITPPPPQPPTVNQPRPTTTPAPGFP